MKYFKIGDCTVSALGYGCMRFPTVEDDVSRVDMEKTAALIDIAISGGINYFDTAWMYHGGTSESVIGKILSKYPRDSYYIADKFPGLDNSPFYKMEQIFSTQLERTGMEYFDFYLCHNVSEKNIDMYFDESVGAIDFLLKKKAEGKIRHLGFSTHGSIKTIKRFLDAYGKHMEFCQIQLNWLDWTFQNAERKVALLREYGLPVFVMEPVRGGRLTTLPESIAERLRKANPEYTAAEWALRFAGGTDGVALTLSGMSNEEQLRQNLGIFDDATLTDTERQTLVEAGREMASVGTVPCTACQYCTAYCPLELNIPWFIEHYNNHVFSKRDTPPNPKAFDVVPENKRPSACLSCHRCESVCPQHIKITEVIDKYRQ